MRNVEQDLSLTALMAGTVTISLTYLSTSDSNSFWDAFSDKIIVMTSNLFSINNVGHRFQLGL